MPRILLLLLALVLAAACEKEPLYRSRSEIAPQGWAYQDSIRFDFEVTDTLEIFNLNLRIAHSPDFPFQNIYTRIHTTFPDGQRLSEVLSLELTDGAGAWAGRCRGGTCRLDIPLQQGAYFSQQGPYRIVLEQFMREPRLEGVRAFTLSIEPTGVLRSE